MRKVTLALILIITLVISVSLAGCSASSVENMIGTTIHLEISGVDSKVAEREIYSMIRRVESSVSTSKEDSIISRINGMAVGESVELDDIANDMISASYTYYNLTGGSFDISVFPLVDAWKFSPDKVSNVSKTPPTDEEIESAKTKVGLDRAFTYDGKAKTITKNIDGAMLDLGAVAKGYIADKANDILLKHNIDKAIIDIGGTLYLNGDKKFKVGIKNPRKKPSDDLIIKVVELENIGVSTSGDYERYYFDEETGKRYHHIIDPILGKPADNGICSVTIISKSAMLTDILSTSVFVLGKERGLELLKGVDEVSGAIIMTMDGDEVKIEEYHKGENI